MNALFIRRRIFAGLIDYVWVAFPILALMSLFFDGKYSQDSILEIDFLFYMLIAPFVHILLIKTWGTTPGKRLMKLRVRNTEGEKPTWKQACKRELFKVALPTLILGISGMAGKLFILYPVLILGMIIAGQKENTVWYEQAASTHLEKVSKPDQL